MPDPIITPAFSIHACRGLAMCPHSAVRVPNIMHSIKDCLERHSFESELRARISGPLRHHHRLRVSISLCPNGCSQPQIADIGLLGAASVQVTEAPCSGCGACVKTCREDSISLSGSGPNIDTETCVRCGACAEVCPEGTITEQMVGLRVQLGGKLGRHPMLGRELGGIHSEDETVRIIDRCVELYLKHFTPGKRLGDLLRDMSPTELEETFRP